MPSAARAWCQMTRTFLKQEGCNKKVGYEESMCQTTINGNPILLSPHMRMILLSHVKTAERWTLSVNASWINLTFHTRRPYGHTVSYGALRNRTIKNRGVPKKSFGLSIGKERLTQQAHFRNFS